MLGPYLKLLRTGEALWKAGSIGAIGRKVCQQFIIGAAITVPPVINGAYQFFLLASARLPNQALTIWPATVGISSSWPTAPSENGISTLSSS